MDRLLTCTATPVAGDRSYLLDDLNPDSVKTITAQLEAALKDAKPEERFQFELARVFCGGSEG